MGDAHRFRYYVRPNLPLFPPVFVFAWGVLAADPLLALDRASADWVTAGRCARAPPTASAFSTVGLLGLHAASGTSCPNLLKLKAEAMACASVFGSSILSLANACFQPLQGK